MSDEESPHTCTATATTADGSPPPPCAACAAYFARNREVLWCQPAPAVQAPNPRPGLSRSTVVVGALWIVFVLGFSYFVGVR